MTRLSMVKATLKEESAQSVRSKEQLKIQALE